MTATTDTETRYQCTLRNHPSEEHRHFDNRHGANPTYSRDLNYVSTSGSERYPGIYVRDTTLPIYDPGAVEPDETTTDAPAITPMLGLTTASACAYGYPLHTPVLVFTGDDSRAGMNMILSRLQFGYTPVERHLRGLTAAERAWITDIASRHSMTLTWSGSGAVRPLGPLRDAERMFSEGEDWAYRQIPGLTERAIAALESRVGEALREQKEEREWCSELEDEWLPQMMLPRKAVRQTPEYRTFEVEVTLSARSTFTTTSTVTVEVGEDGEEEVRRRGIERATRGVTNDLRDSIDFGSSRYAVGDIEYEVTDTDVEEEFDSDEDGEPTDD